MDATHQHVLKNVSAERIPSQPGERHPAALTPVPRADPSPDLPETGPPQPPRRGPGPLRRHLTLCLRTIAGLDLTAGAWLLLVKANRVPCATRLCDVATLNGKHELAGLIAVTAALLLMGAAVATGGLTRAGAVTTALLVGIALIGLLALIGIVLAVALVLSPILIMLGLALAVRVGSMERDWTK